MGSRLIPDGSLVLGDASLFIYGIEKHVQFGPQCEDVLTRAATGTIRLAASELIVTETLVKPLQLRQTLYIAKYEALFKESWLELLPVDRQVLRGAATLRSQYAGLHTPDAIHFATLRTLPQAMFVTNDHRLATLIGPHAFKIADL